MTAINIIKQRHAVHMITDGSSWVFELPGGEIEFTMKRLRSAD